MASRSILGLVLSAVVLLTSTNSVQGLAYPKVARKTCVPSFSGLTQTIRHSTNVQLGWQAVAGTTRGVEGVKAATITKHSLPEMEWFVETIPLPPTKNPRVRAAQRQKFEITAASSTNVCTTAGLTGQQPFGQTSCTDAHAFYITCDTCDHHDDSAWGCQIESVARDKCVEGKTGSGELSWKNCVVGQGLNLPNQLFDISPLF